MKEWEKAKAACEQALSLAPDFQLAKNNLEKTLQSLEQ